MTARTAGREDTGLRRLSGTPAAPPPGRVPSWIRGAFLDHLPIKALAVVLTLTVFLLVGSDEDREIGARIGVSYVLPEGKVLVSGRIDEVRVTIKGPWRKIKRFDEREIDRITLDLSKVVAGEVVIPPESVRLPAGLTLTSITPRAVRVAFENRVEKVVDVAPALVGHPVHGFSVGADGPKSDPPRVTVRGAEGVIAALGSVRTQEISLDGRRQSYLTEVALLPPDGVDVDWKGPVTVSVPVSEQLVTTTVAAVPVTLVGEADASRWKADPSEVTVELTGGVLAVERAIADGVKVKAAITPEVGARGGSVRLVAGDLPPGVGVALRPAEVRLRRK
ncbi:MAG TPA: CdaR family protein [Kofleriaceae bacterium]|nr:CdaR family protein [Kofleriaceae bacterium]